EAPERADWTDVSPETAAVLRQALALDPSDRWPDAASFRSALEKAHAVPSRWRWAAVDNRRSRPMLDPHEALHKELSDRYELEDVLGEGGMGTVYLARDRKHDRPVAIKTIHPDRTTKEVRKRFEREISITARLQHPHILPLLDSGVAGETLYYVMPFVEGESLQQRLGREGCLPLEEALQIAREVASALGYAHGRGVVHRDIKPGNIMLAGGSAVVTDFGIAKAIAEAGGERVTQAGLTMGSPAYMSPEQSSGERPVDGRSDIYSLGCVLYEMLAGEPPFTGQSPLAVIARSIREEAPPLRSKAEGVPPEVEGAVHKALAKAPEDRFQTAEAFAQALTPKAIAPPTALEAFVNGLVPWGAAYAAAVWLTFRALRFMDGAAAWPDPGRAVLGSAMVIGIPIIMLLGWHRVTVARRGWRTPGSLALAALMGVAALAVPAPRRPPADVSIAFVPCDYQGPQEDTHLGVEVFERLHEAAGKAGFRPASRSMARRFGGRDSQEIGDSLGVENVVHCAIRVVGDSVRFTAILDDTRRGVEIQSRTYEFPLGQVFERPSEVIRDLMVVLDLQLPEEVPAVAREPEPDAVRAYARGRQAFLHTRWGQAESYFLEAQAIDPEFALPHAGLAHVYLMRREFGDLTPERVADFVRRVAGRAIELDSTSAEAHTAIAELKSLFDRDWEAAESAYRKAIQLDSTNELARFRYAYHLSAMGRHEEAIQQAQIAYDLEPTHLTSAARGAVQWYAGNPSEAIRLLSSTVEEYPRDPEAKLFLIGALISGGQRSRASRLLDELAELLDKIEAIAPRPFYRAIIAAGYAGLERRPEAHRLLSPLISETQGYVPPFWIAAAYAQLGESERSIEYLERAFDQKDRFLRFVNVLPLLDPIRSHPRFLKLVDRMDFPEVRR
ncbi:MAG: protein kinase, partial [Gemmatimonadota bacterium]